MSTTDDARNTENKALKDASTARRTSNVAIRCYRNQDGSRIRSLLLEGTLAGPDAPYVIGTSRYATHKIIAYGILIVGLGALWPVIVNSYRTKNLKPDGASTWGLGVVVVLSIFAIIYFRNHQRAVRRLFQVYINDALEKDLKDVGKWFELIPQEGTLDLGPNGVRGFWVAVEDEEVVGCIGLGVVEGDPKVGEMWRMLVSSSHRRQGLGQKLLEVLEKHGRASGLVALELSTSDFNVGAMGLYTKCGFKFERRRLYGGLYINVFRKELGH